MSRSFSVDLTQFTLSRPIATTEKALERKIDVIDVISVLQDEGFSEFNEHRVYHRMHGHDRENIRALMQDKIIGVPRDAYVTIEKVGKAGLFLLISFDY